MYTRVNFEIDALARMQLKTKFFFFSLSATAAAVVDDDVLVVVSPCVTSCGYKYKMLFIIFVCRAFLRTPKN